MYKYAQILNDKVHLIMEHEANIDELYSTYFSKEIVFIDITNRNDIEIGWGYNGTYFTKPTVYVPTQEELRQQALARIEVERKKAFDETQWVFMRQQTGTLTQKLSDTEYQKYINYWAEWRDFPNTCTDIFNPVYPKL